MPPAIFSPDAPPFCGSPLSCLQNPGVLGQRPGRRQTLTSARCGTIRKPTTPATGKHDHNSDNHPKSPDLKVVKPYDINSARNTLALILRFSNGAVGAVNNLCLGTLIEAVCDSTRTVGIQQVNAVLMQPHRCHNEM